MRVQCFLQYFVTITTFYQMLLCSHLNRRSEYVILLCVATDYSNIVAYIGLLAGGYVVALLASKMQRRMVGCGEHAGRSHCIRAAD